MSNLLTAEELLSGASLTYTVPLPSVLVRPSLEVVAGGAVDPSLMGEVVLRPLQVRDIERAARAAKEQRVLTSVLMVQQSLVSPKLTIEQVGSLPAGVVQFLLQRVNRLSGLSLDEDDLEHAVRAPMARACFVLAREFGWTPAQCSDLTVGQVLLYLEMLTKDGHNDGA